jgi:F-type H+-transporting ATPase subunit delta
VTLKVLIDPSVIGGVVARVGDQVFDGSIRGRFEDVRQQLGSV